MRSAPAITVLLLIGAACGGEAPKDAPPEPAPKQAPAPEKKAEPTQQPPHARAKERAAMVQVALVDWGVKDETVIEAMKRCPRHRFVPGHLQSRAYWNRPLPIGHDQTISQPTIVGSMTEELKLTATSRVLEIGTGSGYQAAVLAEITPYVYSIEIKAPLAESAKKALQEAGYTSVQQRTGDGYYGWPEEAPFDAIIVTAAAPHVPPPLVKQLKPGGRLILPVGPPFARQDLVLVIKDESGKVFTQSLYAVAFVPLTGSLGKSND
ncbi:MAG: protein-L-isoaspartate(D-aspartate) O-methyltransferase [Planctomycetota bacterium]|nr:protein-L-isoaspartate(D-aspartate) O-methyltransferase [Planctomycetota bacterium]